MAIPDEIQLALNLDSGVCEGIDIHPVGGSIGVFSGPAIAEKSAVVANWWQNCW